MISRNDYDSFGEIVSSTGSSQNSITYTGQRLDVESGLMALGNGERYYNPSYGRFIQQDRFAGLPQMPQSLNRFSYTHNNPTKYTDPSGNVIPLIPIVVGALAFAGAFLIGVTVVENEKIVRERNEEFIKQGVDSSTLPNSTATAVFNSAPVIGSGFKAYFGQDTITGEDLNWFWRGVEGASTILDALPVLIRAKGLRNAPRLFKAKEVAKQSDEIIDDGLDIAKNVSRTEDGAEKVAESAKKWNGSLPEAVEIKGTAQISKLDWKPNPKGVVRSLEEAEEIARKHGVEIPDNIKFGLGDPKRMKKGTYAEYGGVNFESPDDLIYYKDFQHKLTNKIPVRIHPDILKSDEAIVEIFAHEMHEINELNRIFDELDGVMTVRKYAGLVDAKSGGTLHEEAINESRKLVLEMRRKNPNKK